MAGSHIWRAMEMRAREFVLTALLLGLPYGGLSWGHPHRGRADMQGEVQVYPDVGRPGPSTVLAIITAIV